MSVTNDEIKISDCAFPYRQNLYADHVNYLDEWERICRNVEFKEISEMALDGQFSKSNFRSIYWRVLLNILPGDSTKWLSVVRSYRESYETSRHQLMVTPGITDQSLDPNINNPLSQDETSLWNQYFEDSELKRIIRMDVTRTFPEVDFFQTPRIQEMMVSILFCYARKYPQLCYLQGMHEVLAPLAFSISYDHQVYQHLVVDCTSKKLLQELMDEAYLEHDSYILFESVMTKLSAWYEDEGPKINFLPRAKLMSTQPFARVQDMEPTTKIVQKLTRIHDVLLKQHEPEVHTHLTNLEIAPQLYGIRWARLMFGREFLFFDVLLIWDAIFADPGSEFVLIDYLIIALLSHIKEKLLSSDYVESMKLLMRYPPTSYVQAIIYKALHFRDPKVYPYANVVTLPPFHSLGEEQSVQDELQFASPDMHGTVTRSTSLPRHHSSNLKAFKHRSTSVDQKSRSGSDGARRKPLPVETRDPLNVVSFRNSRDFAGADLPRINSHNGATHFPTSESAATKVVSGLAKLGERLGRPKESSHCKESSYFLIDQPMDELKYMEKSTPIPTPTSLLEDCSSNSTSSGEETDPSFPPKKITGSLQKLSIEGVLTASLSCALRLSHYQAKLATRLAQLNIENDLTLRSAMEGISEVVETLKIIKDSPRKSPVKKTYNEFVHASSLPVDNLIIDHPLMGDDSDL